MEGHVRVLEPLRLRLALLRGRSAELQDRIERYGAPQIRFTWDIAGAAAWLDAAAALRLTEQVEAAATGLSYERTYIEPFLLRALAAEATSRRCAAQNPAMATSPRSLEVHAVSSRRRAG